MAMDFRERLELIKNTIDAQTEAWERAKAWLAALGDVQLAVPRDVLDEIDRATTIPAPAPKGVRG